jgi:hypothetical protein
MPGLLTEIYCVNSVKEMRGLSMMKLAYDLYAVHTTILQKKEVYQPHSNNIHQQYNRQS